MTNLKMTTIIARKSGYVEPTALIGSNERWAQVCANDPHRIIATLRGHWKPISAANHARRSGAVGPVEVVHSTADMSGHGYGGYDRAYIVSQDGAVSDRPLSQSEREYDDAEDVNAACDAVSP